MAKTEARKRPAGKSARPAKKTSKKRTAETKRSKAKKTSKKRAAAENEPEADPTVRFLDGLIERLEPMPSHDLLRLLDHVDRVASLPPSEREAVYRLADRKRA